VSTFPQEWSEKIFSVISSMNGRIGWQGLKQSEFTQNPEEPFLITGMNFKDGIIHWDEVYHIPEKRYEEAKNIQLRKEDILMTKDGTIGKILFIDNIPHPNKASLNSHLLVFRPIAEQYVPKFLFYQLLSKSFLEHIELNKSGTTFFGITEKSIGKFKIHLPPIPEQRNIAKSLSDTDELIQQLDYLIKKKKNIKQGAIQELLTGKRRLCGFNEKWKETHLEDCLTKKPEYGINAAAVPYSENLPVYIRITDISKDGKFLSKNKTSINHVDSKHFFLEKNDLVIARTGASTGKTYLYNPKDGKLVFAGFLIRVKVDINKLIPEYLKSFTETGAYWNWVRIMSMRSGQPGINGVEISQLPILLPSLKEQKVISPILIDMDREIEELENKKEKYTMIKNGMMQKLLTGEIRLA